MLRLINQFARLRASVLAAAVVLGCSMTASAVPYLDINFDADTSGVAPTVGASSNPISIPGAIGGYTTLAENVPPTADNGTILVNNAGSMTKAAVFTTNPDNGELGALYMDTGLSQLAQTVAFSFDFSVLAAPTNATVQPKTLNGSGSAGILFGINTFGTAQGTRFAAAPTSATGGVFAIRSPNNADLQSFFNYTEGDTYHIDLYSDYNTGLVSTFVDSVFTGTFAFAFGPAAGVTTQEFFMHLNGESGFANSVAIDNIVAAVPEPTSLALLGVAGLTMLRRRRAA